MSLFRAPDQKTLFQILSESSRSSLKLTDSKIQVASFSSLVQLLRVSPPTDTEVFDPQKHRLRLGIAERSLPLDQLSGLEKEKSCKYGSHQVWGERIIGDQVQRMIDMLDDLKTSSQSR